MKNCTYSHKKMGSDNQKGANLQFYTVLDTWNTESLVGSNNALIDTNGANIDI